MNEQAKALSFDIIANLQSQLNNAVAQNEQFLKVVQAIGQIADATQDTKLEDLPALLEAKLSEKAE